MSRFASLDLSALPDPSAVVTLDYDALLEARLVELQARLSEAFSPSKVDEIMALARNIAASPMRYLNEAAAARELVFNNKLNQALRSIHLATAIGTDLDLIGADRGVTRRILDDSDPKNVVYEGDEPFRARIQLVIEAFSPHGTEGSYVYWTLDADVDVVDVAVYGPNHDVVPAVEPSNVKIVIVGRDGDGSAPQDMLDAVYQNCIPDKRRPAADRVEVLSAISVPYAINAVLHVTTPEAADAVLAAANETVQAFINNRLRVGRKVYRTSLAASLAVAGVVDVVVAEPAVDVEISEWQAPHCTGVTLDVEVITGGWRDV